MPWTHSKNNLKPLGPITDPLNLISECMSQESLGLNYYQAVLIHGEGWLNENHVAMVPSIYIPLTISSHRKHLTGLWKQLPGPYSQGSSSSGSGRVSRISISIPAQPSRMLLRGPCPEDHGNAAAPARPAP